jgi:signal transduction histidine kinase
MGLNVMRYRAGIIGATLSVESIKPKGVRVTCTLPKPT